jgi:5-methyltetrahydrofolate--homocysteine methyltransferase
MICIETMMDIAEAKLAIEAALSLDPAIPVMATMTFNKASQGFFTLMGSSVKNASAALEKAGASIVGSNCGNGMESMVGIAREFQKCAHVPIAIQGMRIANRKANHSPEMSEAESEGTAAVGSSANRGCCMPPEHIRAIRKVKMIKRAC